MNSSELWSILGEGGLRLAPDEEKCIQTRVVSPTWQNHHTAFASFSCLRSYRCYTNTKLFWCSDHYTVNSLFCMNEEEISFTCNEADATII